MKMPKKYKKGKSNRLTHKTSIWTLVAKGRFGVIDDLRSWKAKEKLYLSIETKPNISKEIKSFVIKPDDKKIEYDDLQAYQQKKQEQRQIELEQIRAQEQRKEEKRRQEVDQCRRGFGKISSTYNESKYIQMVNPFEPINKNRLGHSQTWRDNKSKKKYY